MSRVARQAAYAKGRRAEAVAAGLLMLKGYRILERRYRVPQGEVDLVARRGRRVAFVEVKARPTHDEAAWAISARQQARIARAAQHWLAVNAGGRTCEPAFDVVLVSPWSWPCHMADAFRV